MARQYQEISWQTMHNFCVNNNLILLNAPQNKPNWLKPQTYLANMPSDLNKTQELVYGKRVFILNNPAQLSLRLYTTITNNTSRDYGTDAIRLTIFWREIYTKNNLTLAQLPKLVGGSTKTLRIVGWEKNLKNKLDQWNTNLGPQCPKCNRFMVEREGKFGKFWGCTGYPHCTQIIQVGQENAPRCPLCSNALVKRTSKNGEFMGCSTFPKCRFTENIAV